MAIHNNDFELELKNLIDFNKVQVLFIPGNIGIIMANNKFLYLFQSPKGDIKYKFTLLDEEFHTTTKTKLSTVLSQHFEILIEVYNNYDELLKKKINLTSGVSKAINQSERHLEYQAYQRRNDVGSSNMISSQSKDSFNPANKEEVYDLLEVSNNSSTQKYTTPLYSNEQEMLNETIITLSTYQLNNHTQASCIFLDKVPIGYKEEYRQDIKQACYKDKNNLNIINTFAPSEHMLEYYCCNQQDIPITFLYIYYMAKKNITKAMTILKWTIRTLINGEKLPYVMALISEENTCMKIYYEEILMPYLNIDNCEKIEFNNLNKKDLPKMLDQKALYNFHNITSPLILNTPSMEFTDSLIYQDELKLNNKTITTRGNILITSTCNYLPLLDNEIPSYVVDVESNVAKFCEQQKMDSSPRNVINLIREDRDNFIAYLRSIDTYKLEEKYTFVNQNFELNVILGTEDILNVFNTLVNAKYIALFNNLKVTDSNLYDTLEKNFEDNKIIRPNLLKYFESVFGKGHYKNNNELIEALKLLSSKKHPFDNDKISQSGRIVYYELKS